MRLPFVFTQDDLLTASDFLKEATHRGYRLDLETLSELHGAGIMKPLFRVGDVAAIGRQIETTGRPDMNARGWVFHAASEGRLREVADEGRSVWEPYARSGDEGDYRWWNGFVYSSWQLLEVRHALNDLEFHRLGWGTDLTRTRSNRAMPRTLALCALATRHLPSVLSHYSVPGGWDGEPLWNSRWEIGDRERLELAGFPAEELRSHAEQLLIEAHMSDPMVEWLPLMRHASHSAWKKLKGLPLDAHWRRVAAEVFLRAHEELAAEGSLEPLPEPERPAWWSPLQDRLSSRTGGSDSLDRALGSFGLSPYPRVLLLVEGETELVHIPRLLELFGVSRPHQVRVQSAGGSKVNPQLIARYAVSPRIGPRMAGQQFLDATPTALIIAMDPEHSWRTDESRTDALGKIHRALRDEVQRQGAEISDDDLAFLARVFVWGDQTYELANFTDEELADALVELAVEQHVAGASEAAWREQARSEFGSARATGQDAGVAIGRMRVRADKPHLAELLWPTLQANVQAAQSGTLGRPLPVHELIVEVRKLVSQLSAGGYVLRQPQTQSKDE